MRKNGRHHPFLLPLSLLRWGVLICLFQGCGKSLQSYFEGGNLFTTRLPNAKGVYQNSYTVSDIRPTITICALAKNMSQAQCSTNGMTQLGPFMRGDRVQLSLRITLPSNYNGDWRYIYSQSWEDQHGQTLTNNSSFIYNTSDSTGFDTQYITLENRIGETKVVAVSIKVLN
jgi:hypothetical protein